MLVLSVALFSPAVASVGQAALRQGVQLCSAHQELSEELMKVRALSLLGVLFVVV